VAVQGGILVAIERAYGTSY